MVSGVPAYWQQEAGDGRQEGDWSAMPRQTNTQTDQEKEHKQDTPGGGKQQRMLGIKERHSRIENNGTVYRGI